MVDIHTHILFEVDDGAQSREESLMMCQIAGENDIDAIITTSHFIDVRTAEEYVSTRQNRIDSLKEEAAQRFGIQLYPGAEVHITESMLELKDFSPFALNHSRYLLAEFPFHLDHPQIILDQVDQLFDRGVVPILAHPERLSYLQKDYQLVNELNDMGALFQVTLSSLAGNFGREALWLSMAMVQANMVDCLASDAHRPLGHRGIDLLEQAVYIRPAPSNSLMHRMLVETPTQILHNQAVSSRHVEPIFRHRTLF
nr:CpsB/CapC family capsule biosynthesis tyrosine phosphatase [uncultured Solibaculum sp.]